jgi:hypothetical protein
MRRLGRCSQSLTDDISECVFSSVRPEDEDEIKVAIQQQQQQQQQQYGWKIPLLALFCLVLFAGFLTFLQPEVVVGRERSINTLKVTEEASSVRRRRPARVTAKKSILSLEQQQEEKEMIKALNDKEKAAVPEGEEEEEAIYGGVWRFFTTELELELEL